MNYNMSAVTDSLHIFDIFVAVDTASGHLLGWLTLVSLFVIILVSLLRQNEAAESIAAASLVCALVSLLFLSAGIINIIWVIGFTALFGFSAAKMYAKNYV